MSLAIYLIYMAANITAVILLIQQGGVLAIMCTMVMLLGLITLSGAVLSSFADKIIHENKRKEEEHERMGT